MTQEVAGLITPDFTQAQDQVEPGIFHSRIVKVTTTEWAAKDDRPATPVLKWELETFNEAEPKNNGRKIFLQTAIGGKYLSKFENLYFAAMGEKYKRGTAFDAQMLMGREVELTLVQQKTNADFTDVASIKPIKRS